MGGKGYLKGTSGMCGGDSCMEDRDKMVCGLCVIHRCWIYCVYVFGWCDFDQFSNAVVRHVANSSSTLSAFSAI